MTVDQVANTIHQVCIAEGSASFASSLMDKAKAAILGGRGSVGVMVNGSANGKSHSFEVSVHPMELLDACSKALARYAGDGTDPQEVSSTLPDFSSLRL